jgi:hypothetical protein
MRVGLVAILAALGLAPGAGAATVELQNTGPYVHSTADVYQLGFGAAPGEVNDVTIDSSPAGIVVRDAGAPLTAGTGCRTTPDGAICSLSTPGGVGGGAVDLGDGDDRIASTLRGPTRPRRSGRRRHRGGQRHARRRERSRRHARQ